MPPLQQRLLNLPPYPLAHIPAKKRELIARGVDLIDLGAGDADLAPPDAALERMARAIREPALGRYGFGMGLVEFREAIVRFMKKRFGVDFDPMTEVVPLIGSKEGLAHLAFAYLDHGDYAIMPEPGYNAYMGGTVLSNGIPYRYPLRADNGLDVDLDEVPADVLARTKLLYLNYPGNPTAAIAPREYLERTVAQCRERDILLVYDNAYSEVAYDGYVPPSIFEIEGAREVALEFHSMSKTYNMTGWRCGWAVGRTELAGSLAKVKSFIDTGSFMAIQAAAAAALDVHDEFVPKNMAVFKTRRDAAVDAFRANGFECNVPKAAMYLWIPLPEGIASADFANRLMDEGGVVVMAGSSFGAGGEGYFRISFITSPERIREAADRAGRVLQRMTATVDHVTRSSDRVAMKPTRRRGPSPALLASLALHAVVIALFVQALVMKHPIWNFLGGRNDAPAPVVEHIGFLQLPTTHGPTVQGRSGGDGRSTVARAAPTLVAPREVPATIAPPRPSTPVSDEPSSGPLIGGGGALRGIQPRYGDARLWSPDGVVATAPKTDAQRLDSVIKGDITHLNDSLRIARGDGRAPGDWTFEKGGRKYGIDQKYIRLGPVSIPTAVLALLPLNLTGNPTTYDRNKTLDSRHDEIFEQAQRGMNEADFQKAVREIRQRKDRERRDAPLQHGKSSSPDSAP